MDLNELNSSVTVAILKAEALCRGTLESQSAFREISLLEESIAALTSAKEVDGEIARFGAVAAALSAGESLRALQLADRYSSDELSVKCRSMLDDLVREAESVLARAAIDAPNVVLVKFHLHEARGRQT